MTTTSQTDLKQNDLVFVSKSNLWLNNVILQGTKLGMADCKHGGPNLTLSYMLSLFLSPMQAKVLFAKSKQAFPKLGCRQQHG